MLFLDADGADPIFDVFRGLALEPRVLLAGGVRVRVENGSGRPDRVRAAAAYRLAAAGFLIDGVADAAAPVAATTIRFAEGQEAAAVLVAGRLAGPSALVADPTLFGLDVVLVMGRDWDGVSETATEPPPPSTPESTTTTTKATTSTTAATAAC